MHYARGDYRAARVSYAAAQARTRDDGMRGKIILNLGVIENIEGDLEAAHEHYERAYRLFRDTGDMQSAALALHNRGMVEADLAQWDAADVGDEVGRGEALRWRAHALGRAGEPAAAGRSAMEAMQIAVRAGARLLEAESARDLGVLRGLLGDRAGGAKLLHRALNLFTELGARREATEVGKLLQRPTPNRSIAPIAPDPKE